MDNQKMNKNIKLALGVIVPLLLFIIAYVYMSNSSQFSLSDNREAGTIENVDIASSGDTSEKGGWYLGYTESGNTAVSYSQPFNTKKECLVYESEVKRAASTDLAIRCFTSADDPKDANAVDVRIPNVNPPSEPDVVDESDSEVPSQPEEIPDETEPETSPEEVDDDTPPTISIQGDTPTNVAVGALYEDRGATASDVEDGDLSDMVNVTGLPIDTANIGTHTVTYSVTDSANNYVEISRTVKVDYVIDMTSEVTYLESCFGKAALGPCAVADVNGDGAVDESDKDTLIDILFPFEVSGDPFIDLSPDGEVHSCLIKIGDECAKDVHPDIEVTRTYLTENAYNALLLSADPEDEYALNLSTFASLLGDSTLDTIIYDSVAQYDLNEDGILDVDGWTHGGTGEDNLDKAIYDSCVLKEGVGECAKADINGDGMVLMWDLGMFTIMQSMFLPESFTVKDIDVSVFDRTMFSDVVIVRHCVEHTIIMGYCELVDFNKDGVVDAADEQLFFDTVPQYDFTGDGMLDGITIPFEAFF